MWQLYIERDWILPSCLSRGLSWSPSMQLTRKYCFTSEISVAVLPSWSNHTRPITLRFFFFFLNLLSPTTGYRSPHGISTEADHLPSASISARYLDQIVSPSWRVPIRFSVRRHRISKLYSLCYYDDWNYSNDSLYVIAKFIKHLREWGVPQIWKYIHV